ncbi:hypothetical protein BS17DRAFT_567851 [Gyrodon lividus]|nr:hypothetical protein BS17DRAFT_567851 [Gyrodon lividus]
MNINEASASVSSWALRIFEGTQWRLVIVKVAVRVIAQRGGQGGSPSCGTNWCMDLEPLYSMRWRSMPIVSEKTACTQPFCQRVQCCSHGGARALS